MLIEQLRPNIVVYGSLFPEPVQIIATIPVGDAIKLIGKGMKTNQVHDSVLNLEQIATLEASPEKEPFDGDPVHFRLGIEALRLSLAYEYDPYFSLSIARVDPLPHQLEAVYDYFMRLPRIRFLLADDPGAGKTIMAGLLIKELKIRGLVKRILIVTPANLTFQWQRELTDKFREKFEIIRGDVLRANYGSNPWQERNQVISSLTWLSVINDAKESLLRSQWDLIIVDEAHKMSANNADNKTLAYQLGMELSSRTDHYLLMTATPHKGDPKHFCLFLELLDRDVYGDVKSLEEAMKRNSAPFYLRRTKEALITFPDPETGKPKKIFTNRNVQTIEFQIDDEEADFYWDLTTFVEDQSIKASSDDSPKGRALTFTMAMLQRRFASSVCAVRRSLERMREKRERILRDPQAYRQEQIHKRLPEDFEDLDEQDREKILDDLESVVVSVDPQTLREEISSLDRLIRQALDLEKREIESKLRKLKEVLTSEGIFNDPKMKLLLFTEHKDTLDFLVERLRAWNLSVTQIYGGMKIGDRDTPGTRIYAEREFRESCQVLVATEAAGEGINLQFCWFMINYDIPWNPIRLEQRMGRIHRYGQEKDCLILNFVSTNTREGRVFNKLFERLKQIEKDLDPDKTGKVFNVLGDVFPSNLLERMLRDMYTRNINENNIMERIVENVDINHIRHITDSALEGLAKKELNLSSIIGKTAEARERRLVPEVIADFFQSAAPLTGIDLKPEKADGVFRVGKLPRPLLRIGEQLESRYGKLGKEYKKIIFDKKKLTDDPTLEWVTPGHPLFESVREDVYEQVQKDLKRGSLFYDLHSNEPYTLDVFTSCVKDGRGNTLHKRLFLVQTLKNGTMTVKQPTLFLDLSPASPLLTSEVDGYLPDVSQAEQHLIVQSLNPFLDEIQMQRSKEVSTIENHVRISLDELIHRQNLRMAELHEHQQLGESATPFAANIKQVEDRIDELLDRRDKRLSDLEKERICSISDIRHMGRAYVMPHPERQSPHISNMVKDDEVEQIAVQAVIEYENARGWIVESVESQNRGFDLISRKPHPEDSQTCVEVRFIEVKGRSMMGEVALTTNEFKTAERLRKDYWLYVVYHCITTPEVHLIQDPARLGWEPLMKVEHYQLNADKILENSQC